MHAPTRLRRLRDHVLPAHTATGARLPTPTDSEDGTAWSGLGDPHDPFPTSEEAGFPATDDAQAAVAQLRSTGFVVLKGMLTEAEATRHRSELAAHVLDTDAVVADAELGGQGEAAGGELHSNRRVFNLQK